MVSSALKPILQSIADTVADYRQHEIVPPRIDALHVGQWAAQFDASVQLPLLTEVDAILKKTYVPRKAVVNFLSKLCVNPKLAGSSPESFWATANFIDAQQGGMSQSEMLQMFGERLRATFNIELSDCGSKQGPFIYLDDCIFGGNRLLHDMRVFAKSAPARVDLHVVVIATYSNGIYYAEKQMKKAFDDLGKKLNVTFWRAVAFESHPNTHNVDVLRPTRLPASKAMEDYRQTLLPHAPLLRQGTDLGPLAAFSDSSSRDLLEQEFLKKGLHIRQLCPKLSVYHRPLGYMRLNGLGFGSTVVTFRNCPNSCPLVFWVSAPWYPLFPRKNN